MSRYDRYSNNFKLSLIQNAMRWINTHLESLQTEDLSPDKRQALRDAIRYNTKSIQQAADELHE